MGRIGQIGIGLLSAAFVASVGLNIYLFQQAETYYRSLNRTQLDPFGLSLYPTRPEPTHQPILVFYGDSRAEAWVPPNLPATTVINRGINMQTTAQVLGRFAQHVAPLKPRVIVIQVGINDLKTIALFPDQKARIVQNCKANIRQLVEQSLATGADVVLTTIFPLGALPLERRLFWSDQVAAAVNDVNRDMTSLSSARVRIFDTGAILANADGQVFSHYSRDFLHLNPAGYTALNQTLGEVLKPSLEAIPR
jgi:lysophospholipase L1-like esterase